MNTDPTPEPGHARAAAMHADPYPYYARLTAERPVYWDEGQGVWVATSAEAVAAVFESSLCLTRPRERPTPAAMQGTPIADIFARLVRMRDGADRETLKIAVRGAMDELAGEHVAAVARAHASALAQDCSPQRDGRRDGMLLTRFLSALPSRTLGSLLGVPSAQLADVERWTGEYGTAAAAIVTGVPPLSDAVMEAGASAARELFALFAVLVETQDDTLATQFARLAKRAGVTDRDAITANAAGIQIQGQGAIASLMGLTLLALARRPEMLAQVRAGSLALAAFMAEVARCDPPTQSTLRFVARDGIVAGVAMREGDCIIVSIAAANRDPALNRDPHCFDPRRADRQHFEFGHGAHACPGQGAAMLIAQIGVETLLALGVADQLLEGKLVYRPSAHLRIPTFTT